MSKLKVSSFSDNGIQKWSLFYENTKGITQHLTEDFKQLAFDTEEQAKTKLEMMEAEKRSEDAAVSFTLTEAKNFTENHKWKFATTYAKTAPHEYLVKRWLNEEDRLLFERLVQTINEHAIIGYFYDHPNKYLILDDKYYWYMPVYPENMAVDLINRTTTDYLDLRDGVYHYKPKNEEENTNESEEKPNR